MTTPKNIEESQAALDAILDTARPIVGDAITQAITDVTQLITDSASTPELGAWRSVPARREQMRLETIRLLNDSTDGVDEDVLQLILARTLRA